MHGFEIAALCINFSLILHIFERIFSDEYTNKSSLVERALNFKPMLHQRFSCTVLVQCPAPAQNPFSHEEKLRLKDFRGNEAKSWEFLCYDPLSAYVHKKTTISSTARGRGFVAQPVPNQTCVAAVALLILPPASWHFRNQYQKPIYGCVYHCLVLVHVNDVVLFLRQSLKQDEGQKPQRKKFQSQRQTS